MEFDALNSSLGKLFIPESKTWDLTLTYTKAQQHTEMEDAFVFGETGTFLVILHLYAQTGNCRHFLQISNGRVSADDTLGYAAMNTVDIIKSPSAAHSIRPALWYALLPSAPSAQKENVKVTISLTAVRIK